MIETDVVPELPEFEGCENNALCNLDDFSTFTITIKRDCVLDESVAIHEISQEDNTHAHVQAFIDSHQRGLITSIYDAIDNQKKDSLRYFIKIIVHEFPEKISEVFCEIVSHIGCRISLNRQFDVEYIFPILQYLLNNGANINHPNIWGDTPLMVSISFNAIEMQHFLMAVPDCDLNYKNCKSNLDYDSIPMTPLLLAIIYQYTESALSLILDPRIDIHLTNSKYSPLTLAQKMKNDIVIQALLDHGA
jgi:ankyrin repeat protein